MKGRLFSGITIICAILAALTVQAWAEEPTAASSGVRVENVTVCQNVVDRMPIGKADVFSKDLEKVFCFCKVVGATSPTQITFNWYYQGSMKSTVSLPVRSASWRTWSYKTISPEMTGEWMVEILRDDGVALESIIFFIE